ncbi:F-box protein At3g07870-like [Papaver somniferum]|uniref:F-box protein At3g07870-like n=1 Tax=Papaver somniferum TaxID=3469 RepID=UPI000E6F4D25|nr:F-box protein At3g07870-like [Papaver somniferum]
MEILHQTEKEGLLFVQYIEDGERGCLFYGNDCDDYNQANIMEMEPHRLTMEYRHKGAVVGSCNGLVCTGERNKDVNLVDPVQLCNPLTGEYVSLPKFKLTRKLAIHGNNCRNLASGFGYCHSTKEYKVVRIFSQKGDLRLVQVYTVGGKWRCIRPKLRYFNCASSGIYANGSLHWLDQSYSQIPERKIVAFDLEHEKFYSVPMPTDATCFSVVRSVSYLLGGNNNLYLVHTENNCTDIWAYKLKRKKNSNAITSSNMKMRNQKYHKNSWQWIKEFTIEGEAAENFKPFAITRNNEVLLWYKSVFVYCYDPKTSTLNRLWGGNGMGCSHIEVIPHIPSIVSLKDLGETNVRSYRTATGPMTRKRKVINEEKVIAEKSFGLRKTKRSKKC